MKRMFADCKSLNKLSFGEEFVTSKVTNMSSMFAGCSALQTLDVSEFDTSNVTDMAGMFEGCAATSLNITSFDTSSVQVMIRMFANSKSLKTIYVGENFDTRKVTNSVDMFLACNSLVGGQGTAYNEAHIDKGYARIDKGTTAPGYFTAAGAAAALDEAVETDSIAPPSGAAAQEGTAPGQQISGSKKNITTDFGGMEFITTTVLNAAA